MVTCEHNNVTLLKMKEVGQMKPTVRFNVELYTLKQTLIKLERKWCYTHVEEFNLILKDNKLML